MVIEAIITRAFDEIVEDARKAVWLPERKKANINIKEQSNLRQGISCLFPRVQMFNRVTLFEILLINLETAFPRMNGNSDFKHYRSRFANRHYGIDNSCYGYTR